MNDDASNHESDRNPLAPSLELLWHGLPPAGKGPKPKLTLAEIVGRAIEIAGAEGFEALSMRTLAKELDVGTMSLYRYVPSKTELVNLMLDAVTAPGPDLIAAAELGWRPYLEAMAQADRRLYLTHTWVMHANWTRPVMGPSSIAGLDLSMVGLSSTPLTDQERMGVISAVASFAMGATRQEVLWQSAAADSEMTDEDFWNYQIPAMEEAMSSGRYPHMAALAEDTFDGDWESSFAFGLELLLDGLEQKLARRQNP